MCNIHYTRSAVVTCIAKIACLLLNLKETMLMIEDSTGTVRAKNEFTVQQDKDSGQYAFIHLCTKRWSWGLGDSDRRHRYISQLLASHHYGKTSQQCMGCRSIHSAVCCESNAAFLPNRLTGLLAFLTYMCTTAY